ncbi:serine/threonine-protein kinase A-Raf-like isoform X2 [Clytia hemisphaerica]|uniref:serine/threonine-protein kinase A-Raf-like isoform X2 n=1 Tax=Clytia hemisphaerica TaxID=252671 RepID=UPI0034D52523
MTRERSRKNYKKEIDDSKLAQNVEELFQLTSEQLQEMTNMYNTGNFAHPPSILFEEIEELKTKLGTISKQRDEYSDAMKNGTAPPPVPPQQQTSTNSNNSDSDSQPSSPNLTRSTLNSFSDGSYNQSNGNSPHSSLRAHIRAFLPNNQRTMIKYKLGQTVREALYKAMSRRSLTTDSYRVYNKANRELIAWDSDVSLLDGAEVIVEMIDEEDPSTQNISHNFVRKTFFRLAFCDKCTKLLITGFRCTTCNYRFHQKCAQGIPPLCEQAEHSQIYKRLLAKQNPNSNTNIPSTPRPISQRERSISAPNVNMIGQPDSGLIEAVLEKHYKNRTNQETATISGGLTRQMSSGPSSGRGRITNTLFTPTSVSAPNSGENYFDFNTANSLPAPGNSKAQQISGIPDSLIHPARDRKNRIRSSSEEHKKPRRRDSNDDWEIYADDLKIGERIGSGSYGTVYKGYWHGTVAVKTLNVKDPNPQQLLAFQNEVGVLRKTRHVNVLLFMGCLSSPNLAIVTQWCEGSSLYRHLHVLEKKFPMHNLIEIARQTAQGIDYLHAKQIIHRDLKSNNIFLQQDLTVKIGDFGLATVKTRWSGDHGCEQPSGSILWMAPEVIKMQDPNPYTFFSDAYAFGICIYELITGSLPYCNIGNKDILIYRIGRGFIRPDQSKIRSDCPKALKRLYLDCIKYNRDERPLFKQIVNSLETILMALPKITRSTSEPILGRAKPSTDVEIAYPCPTPHTPIQGQDVFSFLSGQPQPVY